MPNKLRSLSRRKFILFAAVSVALPIVLGTAALFAVDLYLHKRAERSAGLNVWGYRGPVVGKKQPGELRLAVLGGSTAFGYGLHWYEAAPAKLEERLRRRHPAGPRISVVNLGYNNEGAYSYRYTLEDFAFLDYDAVVLFDGYNDMFGDAAPNLNLYRHNSPIFRLTGYFPLLPLALREKAMTIRFGGNLNAAYAASRGEAEGKIVFQPNLPQRATAATLETFLRMTDAFGRQIDRLSKEPPAAVGDTREGGCGHPWRHYCQRMYLAIRYALDRGHPVFVVLQPRMTEPVAARHAEQQAALVSMIERRFGAEPRVGYVDLSGVADLNNPAHVLDTVHLSMEGTTRLVEPLAEKLDAFLSAPSRR